MILYNIIFGTLRIQRTIPTVSSSAASLYILNITDFNIIIFFSLSIFFFHISASAFNDLSDIDADEINAPDRILITGSLSHFQLTVLAILLFLTGFSISLWLDLLYGLLTLTFGSLYIILYSFFIPMKSNPIGSFVYLSFSGFSLPFIAALILTRNFSYYSLLFSVFLLILGSCATLSSVKDIVGDSKVNKNTFAVSLGLNDSKILVSLFILAPLLLYPAIYFVFNFSFSILYLSLFPILIRIILAKNLMKTSNPLNLSKYCSLYRFLIVLDALILTLTKPLIWV
mgnify:CR=1 FL=1